MRGSREKEGLFKGNTELFRIKVRLEFISIKITTGLAENGPAGAGIKFLVVRDSKSLSFPEPDTPELDMTAPGGNNPKAKMFEDGNKSFAAQALKPWHGGVRFRK